MRRPAPARGSRRGRPAPSAARASALQILSALDRGRGTLAERLAGAEGLLRDPRDRSLLHELVLGTLRRRGTLDHALQRVSDRPLEGLQPASLAHVLRLGAYQILWMRVPAHAAVSESVELARATGARGAVAFVNALLRRLAREGPPSPIDPGRFPLAWLGTEGSLPAWLAERWLRQLGPGPAVARARAFLDHAPAAFRLNPRVADAWERVVDAGLEPEALRVPGAFRARAGRPADLVSAGVIYLQDEGSQLVAHLAAHGRLLLDACAAPGGKSTLMADLLGPAALVVATEPAPERLRSMARLVRAWGASNVACVGADALCPPFAGGFDSVLIDAPCSGLGTLARRPDIRWRFRPAQLAAQAARQRRLLLSLAALVNAGGILVYSTCSLEPEETTSVSSWFLRQDLGFEPDTLPGWAAPFRNDDLSASVLPERHGGDGFFVASFRRRGGRPW